MTTTIHTCPACQLRFAHVGEMIDHVRSDHRPTEEAPTQPWGSVTVPLDPAGDNERALQVAWKIAAQAKMAMSLVAAPTPGTTIFDADAFLGSIAKRTRAAGVESCTWHLLPAGDLADAVVDVAEQTDTALICMASHARGAVAEAVVGSVSEDVMRRASVPVVLVGPHVAPSKDRYSHLLVPVDGSPEADRAVDAAAALAPRLDADIVLVQVVDPDADLPPDLVEDGLLRRTAARLPATRTDWEVLHDTNPARAITGAAVSLPNALVMMGTHGRRGLQRFLHPSVALDVAAHSTAPVALTVGAPVAQDGQHVDLTSEDMTAESVAS